VPVSENPTVLSTVMVATLLLCAAAASTLTSINFPVKAESDAISLSPVTNVPITVVKTICVPDVSEPNTNPVAPDVAPLI